MKKILIALLSILTLSSAVFALDTVATTYQTNLKPQDMVEIFVEELNKGKYQYQIADYKVYTEPEKQNYAWSVNIGNEGYIENRTKTYERSIYLFMKNGYVCFKTFGGPTKSGFKTCIDANNEDFSKIRDSVYDSIDSYIRESKTWLRRYNKGYSEDELEALNKLYCVTRTAFSFIINEYNFNGKYSVVIEDTTLGDCIKSNNLTWEVSWNQDEELLEFCKRRNCSLSKVFNEDYVDPETIKKAELKKLKKEKQELLCYDVLTYKLYKVQNNEVVGTTLYLKYFLNIDDMLSGDYDYKGCYQYVDKSGNIIYQSLSE